MSSLNQPIPDRVLKTETESVLLPIATRGGTRGLNDAPIVISSPTDSAIDGANLPAVDITKAQSRMALSDGGPLVVADDEPKTLSEALIRTATKFPAKGIKFVETRGESFLNYADLVDRAKRILGGLRQRGLKPKDSVVLQIDSLANHFAAYWACVLGGITPVTVAIAPSYAEKNGVVNKLYNIWKLLEHPVILTSSSLAESIAKAGTLFSDEPFRVNVVEELLKDAPAESMYPAVPSDVVFFQLTSGSTGIPKCIQETHRSLICHIHSSQQFNNYSAEDVTLNWLPMDHVVPILTFHLKDVYLGCTQIHAKSETVLTNPLRWLDLIHENRVTHTWAPNFGFKLVAEALAQAGEREWDLSSVKFFMNAGEQVTTPVVHDFLRGVEPFGVPSQAMQPAFGMAEVCTCMTYANHFTEKTGARRFWKSSLNGVLQETKVVNGSSVGFVSLGPPSPGVQIRITDNQNNLVPEGVIGRFQIKGDVVTPGYLKNDEANREAFVGDGWFNSGDIGFILHGELYLTGREKEMLNIRGANFYCYEIEDVVSQIPEVEPTFIATCGVTSAETGTESLGILFVPRAGTDPKKTAQAIRIRVSANLGISPDYVVFVEKKDFPKTTSGKIQRTQFKKMLEAGAFNDSPKAEGVQTGTAAESETELMLCRIWKEVLRASSVSRENNFFELGGDSLRALQVLSRVRERFGIEIPLSALFNNASTVSDMAKWIETHEKTASLPPIEPAPRTEPLLLSFPQQRLWLLDQLEGSSSLYTVARCLWLDGELDKNALHQSLNEIVRRHEVLRTTFELYKDAPVQIVHPFAEINLPLINSAHSKERALELAIAESQKPFDLKKGPLFRPVLFQLAENQHVLLVTFHQIIVDGWSVGLFLEELTQLYADFRSGKPSSIAPLQIQFADFAQWQRRCMTGERITKQLNYWKTQLAGPRPILKLPTDHPRPAKDTFAGATETLVLPRNLFNELKNFNHREGTTLFMTMLAVYQLLLRHYAQEDDILVGSPVGGRARLETEKLIGFFANTVVLRSRFDKNSTPRKLLGQVRETALAAYANADLPFEKLVQDLQSDRSQPNAGLFQVWFGPIDGMPSVRMGDSDAEVTNLPITPSQFDLTLLVSEKPDEAACLFEYKTDLFERATIQKIAQNYQWLLKEFIANPDQEIVAFDEKWRERDSDLQKKNSLLAFNDTKVEFPKMDSILSLIDEQFKRASKSVAVVCGEESLTYAELNDRTNQVANLLRKNGIGPEIAVGLCVERSLEMIVGILGILKAGGAYVPLDPAYPQERLNYVLQEIQSPLILTQSKFRDKVSTAAKVIYLDTDADLRAEKNDPTDLKINDESLAYIIFTSGSTGKPKGVLVTHQTLLHSTQARMAFYEKPVSNYLLISSFAFDSSIAGIFWTLASGGTLTIPQEGLQHDPLALVRLMLQHRVSHFLSLPSLYSLILQEPEAEQLVDLRCVIVAGESCAQELVERHYRLLPRTALFNEYGPTEATVWCSAIQLQPGEPVTIGRPIPNVQMYILDERRTPVSLGETGEIFIGGAGIVRGYLKRPELTTEKFIADNLGSGINGRLYRTGDLGRYLPDGRIEFLGRTDHQIKLRGHRIELEEIESVLKENPAIHSAVVIAREDKLLAYLVPQNKQSIDADELRAFLRKQMPEHMMPSAFAVLSSLPTMPNGKVDRNALPEINETLLNSRRKEFVAPRTPVEVKLASIWAGVLSVEKIGVHDNFFELGGHSLLAIQIMARIRDAFQIEIPLRTIFESKDLGALGSSIVQLLAQSEDGSELAQLLSELETLTDAEAQALLAQEKQATATL